MQKLNIQIVPRRNLKYYVANYDAGVTITEGERLPGIPKEYSGWDVCIITR
jgi:hypothetical protein